VCPRIGGSRNRASSRRAQPKSQMPGPGVGISRSTISKGLPAAGDLERAHLGHKPSATQLSPQASGRIHGTLGLPADLLRDLNEIGSLGCVTMPS